MTIGIIGAGFTGLAAAGFLAQSGHKVIIWETASEPGGLAAGFKDPRWNWPLEQHYHHIFTSDSSILDLAKSINHPIKFSRPLSSTFTATGLHQLDSPLSLLKFPDLPLIDRLRTAASLAFMRFNPFWSIFEPFTAAAYLKTTQGNEAYQTLWQPLLTGKFGAYADSVSAAWFWARIKKRSSTLGYPEGGFQSLAQAYTKYLIDLGVDFHFTARVNSVRYQAGSILINIRPKTISKVDKLICTLPFFTGVRIIEGLPQDYIKRATSSPGLGAANLVLALKREFLPELIYWTNINRPLPFLAVVEHTHFQSPAHYGGDHLLYIGNYLSPDHRYFNISPNDLLTEFTQGLRQLNPHFKTNWVRKSWLWTTRFAQPIVTPHYSQRLLPFHTPVPNVFIANMQQVYPWDRGTNYAVELGRKVAAELLT